MQLKRRTNEKAQGAFKQWVEQKSSEKLAAEEAEQRRRQKKVSSYCMLFSLHPG